MAQLHYMPGFPKSEGEFKLVAKIYSRFVSVERVTHEYLGEVIPAEWLMEQIGSTRKFFPAAIESRRIYETYFPPKDGLSAESMEGGE